MTGEVRFMNAKFIRMTKLIVLGAGESGVGAAILGVKEGYSVMVSDSGKIPDRHKKELVLKGIAFEEDGHSTDRILEADEVVNYPTEFLNSLDLPGMSPHGCFGFTANCAPARRHGRSIHQRTRRP